MKRIWLIAGAAGLVAVFGFWWLWPIRPASRPMEPVAQQAASPEVPGARAHLPTPEWPDASGNVTAPGHTSSAGAPPPLSPIVERLLREGHKAARASELKSLTPAEQAALVNAYRGIPSITNKMGIARTLAYAGDAQVGELLWWSLTQEYAGRVFERPSEPAQLSVLVKFLGLVAEKDDVIYRRLEQGLDPAFWRTNVTWSGPPRMADRSEVLSRNAIEALVLSGRTEGWQTILNLASNPPPWFESAHASSVVQSAYDHAMIALHGKEWFWENCPGDVNRLANWMMSDQGRPWREWQMRMERGKSR